MIDAEGQTLAGKWANMKAAMARAGETVWKDSGAFDGLKTTLEGITDAFDNTAEAFVPAVPGDSDVYNPHPNCTSYVTYEIDSRWL